jgi:hypothetical protein
MATISDILTTPSTGYTYIDALLATGPDWNFITTDGTAFRTTLYYSFATNGTQYETNGLTAFNEAQQAATEQILTYITRITGISLVETSSAATADLHFATADVANPELGGVCYANYSYTGTTTGQLTSYTADAYIYLDTVATANPAPVAGSWWYQALLHELGHALGLKHPFEATADMPTTLAPPYLDTTGQTLMSYTHTSDAYYSQFNEYDLATLQYLYGSDGLGGDWGLGTTGLYLTGASLDESFYLPNGRVLLTDTGGNDTVYYDGLRQEYTITPLQGGAWLEVSGNEADHLISTSIEYCSFADGTLATSSLFASPGGFIFGGDGSDLLVGSEGSDLIMGGSGNDIFMGAAGDDMLHGGEGLDTAFFAEKMDDLVLSQQGEVWTARSDSREVTLISVERLQFSDCKLALDLDPNQAAGQTALLMTAVLGKEALADSATIGMVLEQLDNGVTLLQASTLIVDSGWFQAGTEGTDADFVRTVFQNMLGEAPSAAMQDNYLDLLQEYGGDMSQAELLAYATLSEENQQHVDLIGLQQSGLVYL